MTCDYTFKNLLHEYYGYLRHSQSLLRGDIVFEDNFVVGETYYIESLRFAWLQFRSVYK